MHIQICVTSIIFQKDLRYREGPRVLSSTNSCTRCHTIMNATVNCINVFMCVPWLIHMCDMRLDLFICVTNLTSACTEYRVATISRLLKITGLFCRRALSKRLYSTNEAYHCILQKSPMILRSLIIVAAPYHTIMNAMEWLQLVRSLKL